MSDPSATSSSASRRLSMPPWLSLVLRLAFTVALLAYALRGVEWPNLRALLMQADWRWWAAGMVTALLVQAVAGVRWAALARPLGFDYPRRFFVWRFFEGMFFNLCLPGSISGDVVKAYRIGDTTSRRLLAGCSVLADRLTGLSALAVLGGAALAARKYDLSLPVTILVAAALLAGVLAVFLVAVSFLDRIVALVPEGSPGRGVLAQLLPYQQRPSVIAKAVAWSFVVQAGGAVGVALSARALGVDQPLSVWFSVVPLVALLMVLPFNIGGFGVREESMKLLLAQEGVPSDQAVGVALLWGLSTIIIGLVGGVLFLLDRSPASAAEPPAER